MFKDNGEVIQFINPKVQASLGSNTFAISGPAETKCKCVSPTSMHQRSSRLALQDMLPTIMSQMGMSADMGFGSEPGRRKAGSYGDQDQSGDGQPGSLNGQTIVENDDEVPGRSFASHPASDHSRSPPFTQILSKILTTCRIPSDRSSISNIFLPIFVFLPKKTTTTTTKRKKLDRIKSFLYFKPNKKKKRTDVIPCSFSFHTHTPAHAVLVALFLLTSCSCLCLFLFCKQTTIGGIVKRRKRKRNTETKKRK